MADMKNGFSEVVALERATELARRLAMGGQDAESDDVPLSDRLWDVKCIGQYFRRSEGYARQIVQIEGFPKPMRYTLPSGAQGQAMYDQNEVKNWAKTCCRE